MSGVEITVEGAVAIAETGVDDWRNFPENLSSARALSGAETLTPGSLAPPCNQRRPISAGRPQAETGGDWPRRFVVYPRRVISSAAGVGLTRRTVPAQLGAWR